MNGPRLSARGQGILLELARAELRRAAQGESPAAVQPPPDAPLLLEFRPCFITLMKRGELRGCVGQVFPWEPLFQAVATNTHNAATRDPRFPPVQPEEVPEIQLEISVLTEPVALTYLTPEELLSQLKPGETGVLFRLGGRAATFLPKVWEMLPDKLDFLASLSRKAGCPAGAWREREAVLSTFSAQSFHEEVPPSAGIEVPLN